MMGAKAWLDDNDNQPNPAESLPELHALAHNRLHSVHVDRLCCGDPGDCQCEKRDAYDLDDPRHPDWYSNAVDLWDLRDRG